MANQVRVGVGVLLLNSRYQVLLGKRKGSHGEGQYAAPGGHQELGESPLQTARREIAEEIGSEVEFEDLRPLSFINMTDYPPKHYLDIGLYAWYTGGKVSVMEPDKVESWDWYDLNNLPEPLFGCTEKYIEAFLANQVFVDLS